MILLDDIEEKFCFGEEEWFTCSPYHNFIGYKTAHLPRLIFLIDDSVDRGWLCWKGYYSKILNLIKALS